MLIDAVYGVDSKKLPERMRPILEQGFNDPLPNMKEITESDFAKSIFFVYNPTYIGYRQISPELLRAIGIEIRHQLGFKFFVFHDFTGVAIMDIRTDSASRAFFDARSIEAAITALERKP